MTDTSTLQRKGQTMVPKRFREILNLETGDTLEWEFAEGSLRVKKRIPSQAGLTYGLVQRLARIPAARRNPEKVSYALPA